jgi:protein-S-isoprenylcysteine O-methyltransferase Ste14
MDSRRIVSWLWLVFLVYWLAAAFGTKRYAPGSRRRGFVVRIVVILAVALLLEAPAARRYVAHLHGAKNPALCAAGAALCAAGLAFAIWARVHLARNWGVPMSLREGHELITMGPYRFVRHPIYTGLLLMVSGSSIVEGGWWPLWLIVFVAYAIYSAWTEERTMMQQFPDQYAEYKKRTPGRFLPFRPF